MSLEVDSKIKFLDERLNRVEDVLNTRAAEIYDLKEQVQMLEIPKEDGLPAGDLNVYKEEIKKQKKTLDEKKWINDQMKLDIIKLKKEVPNKIQKIKKITEEDINSLLQSVCYDDRNNVECKQTIFFEEIADT